MKQCPRCKGKEFYVTAHVTQDWKVDAYGYFIETAEECVQVLHPPGDSDLWECVRCGHTDAGTAFEIEENI